MEFLALGAGNVQFCTAVMSHGFRIIEDLISGLSLYMEKTGLDSVQEIIGRALPNIVDHDSLSRTEVKSFIDSTTCIECQLCYLACRDGGHEAIDLPIDSRIPEVQKEKCVGCGLCRLVCPVNDCIEIK